MVRNPAAQRAPDVLHVPFAGPQELHAGAARCPHGRRCGSDEQHADTDAMTKAERALRRVPTACAERELVLAALQLSEDPDESSRLAKCAGAHLGDLTEGTPARHHRPG